MKGKVPYDMTHRFFVPQGNTEGWQSSEKGSINSAYKLGSMLNSLNQNGWDIFSLPVDTFLDAHKCSNAGTLVEFREEDHWWNVTHFQRNPAYAYASTPLYKFDSIIAAIRKRRLDQIEREAKLAQRKREAKEGRLHDWLVFERAWADFCLSKKDMDRDESYADFVATRLTKLEDTVATLSNKVDWAIKMRRRPLPPRRRT